MSWLDDITDERIADLIGCPKVIVKAPETEYKVDRGHRKKNFEMSSTDSSHKFYGFIRQSLKFTENFSVGLTYSPQEEKGTITLLRCNGPHGPHELFQHHDYHHIHTARAEQIRRRRKPESYGETTAEYDALETAIWYYCRRINLQESDRYFPPPQLSLFE